jgi:TusA-related sulfurtransferase
MPAKKIPKQPLPKPDETLDALGLFCPVPVWEAAKHIIEMKPGQVLELLSDDEGITEDMPAWCQRTGHLLIGIEEDAEDPGVFHVYVRKAGK